MIIKPNRKRNIILIIIATAIILTFAIFFYDSNARIVVTEYQLYYSNLPEAFDGYRIVVLADIHGNEFGRNNERLIAYVIEAAPDIITIPGDLIDEYGSTFRHLEVALTLVSKLVEIAPTYFVTGNHDWSSGELPALLSMLESFGVIILQNDYVLLESDSQSIILAGTDDPNGPADMIKPGQLVSEIKEKHEDSFFIMLEHRNYNLPLYSELGVDLVISGHSHGGIIRLPFTDGLLATRFYFFPSYASGVNTMDSTNMVVSRGLGSSFMWMRLFNNPEVVVVELRVKR